MKYMYLRSDLDFWEFKFRLKKVPIYRSWSAVKKLVGLFFEKPKLYQHVDPKLVRDCPEVRMGDPWPVY